MKRYMMWGVWGAATLAAVVMGLGAVWVQWTGTRVLINTTPSVPRGVYLGAPGTDVGVEGTRVYLTPPAQALELGCVVPGQVLLKDVLAGSGARVCRQKGAHVIDGRAYASHARTSRGEPMPYVLEVGECALVGGRYLWVGSQHPHACDSRVFGAVPKHLVLGRVHGLWLWDDETIEPKKEKR